MLYLIAALGVLWWLSGSARPQLRRLIMPRFDGKLGAVAAVLAALFVLVHGNLYLALVIFGVALWMLGRATRAGTKRDTRVRSKRIEMDLDRATGAMSGRILEGPDAGASLDSLDRERCEAVYDLCRRDDVDGARLLEAYLDRRFSGWRAVRQGDGDAGGQKSRSSGGMSQEQAYQVLGLRHGAAREDIVRAHRSLMKRWHPDQGGTAELAARANEAKDVLLRRRA